MKTRFFALALLALALAACNNDNENLNGGPVAAQFTADIAPVTRLEGKGYPAHAVVEGVVFTAFAGFVGEAHYRAFFVSRGSCGKEEVNGRLVLLRRGIGRGCEDTSRRVVRIVGAESMGLCIFDIDDLSFCLKFPVLQDERHVAVLGIVADVGDADTVTIVPSGSAGTGGGGDVGGKLGGHGITV